MAYSKYGRIKRKGKIDGVVKTSIYGVLSRGDSQHTTCIVETRPGTLLLGVYAYLYIYVFP